MGTLIQYAALAIEGFAMAIILIGIVHGTVRYLIRVNQIVSDAYQQLKAQLGKALLLGLEFLAAADTQTCRVSSIRQVIDCRD